MPVIGLSQAQGLLYQDLPRCAIHKIMTTYHLRYTHGRIIDHHGQLIGEDRAGAGHDEVATNFIQIMRLGAPDLVVPGHRAACRSKSPGKWLGQLIKRKCFLGMPQGTCAGISWLGIGGMRCRRGPGHIRTGAGAGIDQV